MKSILRKFCNSLFKIQGAAAEERARIIDFFSLDLGNPTVILQQEEAKSFFRNNDPRSLYNFFEKGSLLGKEMFFKRYQVKKNTNINLSL